MLDLGGALLIGSAIQTLHWPALVQRFREFMKRRALTSQQNRQYMEWAWIA